MVKILKIALANYFIGWIFLKIIDLVFTIGAGNDFPAVLYLWLAVPSILIALLAVYFSKD